jgi:hypothetical protein
MAKRLELKKELLTELTNDQLKQVAGGAQLPPMTGTETYRCPTLPVNQCFIIVATDMCQTTRCFD